VSQLPRNTEDRAQLRDIYRQYAIEQYKRQRDCQPAQTPRAETRKPRRDPWSMLWLWLVGYVLVVFIASLVGAWIGGAL